MRAALLAVAWIAAGCGVEEPAPLRGSVVYVGPDGAEREGNLFVEVMVGAEPAPRVHVVGVSWTDRRDVASFDLELPVDALEGLSDAPVDVDHALPAPLGAVLPVAPTARLARVAFRIEPEGAIEGVLFGVPDGGGAEIEITVVGRLVGACSLVEVDGRILDVDAASEPRCASSVSSFVPPS